MPIWGRVNCLEFRVWAPMRTISVGVCWRENGGGSSGVHDWPRVTVILRVSPSVIECYSRRARWRQRMRAQQQRCAVECSGYGSFHKLRSKDMALGRHMYSSRQKGRLFIIHRWWYSSRQKGKMIYYTQVVKTYFAQMLGLTVNNIPQMCTA